MNYQENWNKVKETVDNILIPEPDDTLFLFGGGLLCAVAASILKDELDITAVCDNSKEKQGGMVEGLPCISPQKLASYPSPFVLVSTVKYYAAIHQQLTEMGVRHCGLDAYIVRQHFDEFEAVLESLDDASKEVYAGMLLCRVSGDVTEAEKYYCEDQYFCFPKFQYLVNRDGVFVDCGAFVGDTVENIIKYSLATFREICAFEPTERAFAALEKRGALLTDLWALSEGQLVYEKKAVGRKHGFLTFRENTLDLAGSSLSCNPDAGKNDVEVVALDEYFSQREARDVVFIKADIEGSEWDMLHGAAETIRRGRPKLAICIYHNVYDFFRIPLYLKELVPEYQFHIRHHSIRDEETVLYCHV